MQQNIKRDVVTELDDVLLLETTGETALALSVRHQRPVVVYDHAAGDTVVLASAPTNLASATDKAVYYFQQQGKSAAYCRLPVAAGMAHGSDAGERSAGYAAKGVASAEDIDAAMRLGSTTRTGRWPGANRSAGDVCFVCWKIYNSTTAKNAIARVLLPESADGDAS